MGKKRIRAKEIKLSIKGLQKIIWKRFHVLDTLSVRIISTKNVKMEDNSNAKIY